MVGKVITIAQQKGGAGKTTLAIHLAVAWSALGQKVAVLDTDPQASLTGWQGVRATRQAARAGAPQVSAITGWRAPAEIERLAKAFDLVVVDSPPHTETEARVVIRAADLVIVPIQPSVMDLWATQATLNLAKAERTAALLVLNRVPPRSSAAAEIAEEAHKLGVPVATTTLGNRVALASALNAGLGITEFQSSGSATTEVSSLAAEILNSLHAQ
jgi:chromosome partitioning protein